MSCFLSGLSELPINWEEGRVSMVLTHKPGEVSRPAPPCTAHPAVPWLWLVLGSLAPWVSLLPVGYRYTTSCPPQATAAWGCVHLSGLMHFPGSLNRREDTGLGVS